MDVKGALDEAFRILYQERRRPTVEYYDPMDKWMSESIRDPSTKAPSEIIDRLNKFSGYYQSRRLNLQAMREKRPRPVVEIPDIYIFRSENFEMLKVLFAQLAVQDRDSFIEGLLKALPNKNSHQNIDVKWRFPAYLSRMSELPLLAEFVIRVGYYGALVDAINALKTSTLGIAIMFVELEDLVALNFTVFSDAELAAMGSALKQFRDTCFDIAKLYMGQGEPPEKREMGMISREILKSLAGLGEECLQARHSYLRDRLLHEKPNLEVESDKKTVESFLAKLGFSTDMIGSLNAAETEHKNGSTTFELKSSLGHIRSFLEHLHRESAKAIAAVAGVTVTDKWGEATLFLRQKNLISKQHETFVTALYTLISDNSVHPLGADREYARLLRNVVIEYGVMFLTVLDKNAVKIT
jgi:hypothetical protein